MMNAVKRNTPLNVISIEHSMILDFHSALPFKLLLFALAFLLIPFAAGPAKADDHIDNICQIPVSESGWAGHCVNDSDWQAGWYIYRHGTTWAQQNVGWLVNKVSVKPPSVRILGPVENVPPPPPRGTTSGSSEPLPTTRSGDSIATSYHDGTTIIALSRTVSVVILQDGSTVTIDHEAGTRKEVDATTGTESTRTYK